VSASRRGESDISTERLMAKVRDDIAAPERPVEALHQASVFRD
jgi:hypothetical protein